MKLFPTKKALHIHLYNQVVTSESSGVQRLLENNRVEDAYRLWRDECDEEAGCRYEWNARELKISLRDCAAC